MGLYAGSSYVDKLRSAVRVFSAMLTWALENAIDTGDSMKARGYGLKGRSHFALFRFTLRDALLLSAAALLLTLVFLGMMLKKTAFSFYPLHHAAEHRAAGGNRLHRLRRAWHSCPSL